MVVSSNITVQDISQDDKASSNKDDAVIDGEILTLNLTVDLTTITAHCTHTYTRTRICTNFSCYYYVYNTRMCGEYIHR